LKNKALPYTLVLATLMLSLFLESCSSGSASSSTGEATPTPLPTSPALAKPTYTVQRGEVVETVELVGRIAPVDQQPLYFLVDGRVRNIYVAEEDIVEAGTLIADLEGVAEIQRQLELSRIQQQRSQINVEIAQLDLDLFILQTPKGTTGYDQLLAIKQKQLELTELDVQQASLGIQDLQDSLGKLQLIAPMAGQLTSLPISAGGQVHAYSQVGTVADTNHLEVSASTADTTVLDKLEVGLAVTIDSTTSSVRPINGAIRRLPLPGSSSSLQADKTVRITPETSPAEAGYRLGDLVNVTVIVAKKADVLWIPPQAIRTFGGRAFVVVQEGDVQRRVDVRVGVIGVDRAEILTGLTEGQVVVSP